MLERLTCPCGNHRDRDRDCGESSSVDQRSMCGERAQRTVTVRCSEWDWNRRFYNRVEFRVKALAHGQEKSILKFRTEDDKEPRSPGRRIESGKLLNQEKLNLEFRTEVDKEPRSPGRRIESGELLNQEKSNLEFRTEVDKEQRRPGRRIESLKPLSQEKSILEFRSEGYYWEKRVGSRTFLTGASD
ncbi:hypothetical protein RRG08_006983 [Elysia crispata]|uniref:Uncharacterized protein n=1 Tax=Elysia crispata TaxID=231223 RepID=A0AAE1CSE6_9GAST|nr:hypothetical protein RRG08_006983 [Elysia crispata]